MDIQTIKQRFNIIGNAPALNRALDIACQVAPTDLSVLVTGESGTGKEVFPQIIHQFSARKHGQYIAVNCGAIPEGTIDSELFGHEKGAFTGAHDTRKGYFEVADGGTIFLDEVAELPLSTQVRLLRVLETGEFLKVGSSKVLKTNVRVIAATNINLPLAIQNGRFREDLYYRLNTVPIIVPPLRERKDDIYLLFRKFAADFSEKYRMPAISLDNEAKETLSNYPFPGNVRQLKNVTEQISVIESERTITAEILNHYLPQQNYSNNLPVLYNKDSEDTHSFASEREILYQILFDMKKDMNELKREVHELTNGTVSPQPNITAKKVSDIFYENPEVSSVPMTIGHSNSVIGNTHITDTEEVKDESLSLQDKEIELIHKALKKHNNKRRLAAEELGISERTLYRKIKEYNIEEN